MGTNSQFDIQVHQPGLFYTNNMGTTQNKDFSTGNRYHISKKCIYKYLLITTKLLDQNPYGDPNPLYSLQNFGVHVDNFSQCTYLQPRVSYFQLPVSLYYSTLHYMYSLLLERIITILKCVYYFPKEVSRYIVARVVPKDFSKQRNVGSMYNAHLLGNKTKQINHYLQALEIHKYQCLYLLLF